MLGVVGYILPEIFRFPGVNAMSPAEAHAFFVQKGGMSQLLLWVSFLEVFGTIALLDTIQGGDRAPGDFAFDPLGLSKNPAAKQRYQLAEIKVSPASRRSIHFLNAPQPCRGLFAP